MIRLLCFLLFCAGPVAADSLTLLSDIRWSTNNRAFGGLSGLHMSDTGDHVLAITDRGQFVSANVTRKDGIISALKGTKLTPIRQINGKPVSKHTADAEGLALNSRGKIFVSFERFHRIRSHNSTTSKATNIPRPAQFKSLQNNSGLEAIAIGPDDTLYAIPERSGAWERPFPVYRFKGGRWDASLSLPRSKKFLPTDADFGPDGKLYLLERDLAGILGFKTRIRRFSLGKDGFYDEEVMLETRAGRFDNLEGISLWRDPDGNIRIALVSDDNFFLFQKTQIVEFLLERDPAGS